MIHNTTKMTHPNKTFVRASDLAQSNLNKLRDLLFILQL